jgi:transcriptional regulator with XRE-family HTH domain
VRAIYTLFLGKVAEQKKNRSLTNADIAKMTGYGKSAIDKFMCGVRPSENIAKAIAAVLKIEL